MLEWRDTTAPKFYKWISGQMLVATQQKHTPQAYIKVLAKEFAEYLIEFDSVSFKYIAFTIVMTAPGDVLLGASMATGIDRNNPVRINADFPKVNPTCILSSSLYFDSTETYIPATRDVKVPYDPNSSIENNVLKFKYW